MWWRSPGNRFWVCDNVEKSIRWPWGIWGLWLSSRGSRGYNCNTTGNIFLLFRKIVTWKRAGSQAGQFRGIVEVMHHCKFSVSHTGYVITQAMLRSIHTRHGTTNKQHAPCKKPNDMRILPYALNQLHRHINLSPLYRKININLHVIPQAITKKEE